MCPFHRSQRRVACHCIHLATASRHGLQERCSSSSKLEAARCRSRQSSECSEHDPAISSVIFARVWANLRIGVHGPFVQLEAAGQTTRTCWSPEAGPVDGGTAAEYIFLNLKDAKTRCEWVLVERKQLAFSVVQTPRLLIAQGHDHEAATGCRVALRVTKVHKKNSPPQGLLNVDFWMLVVFSGCGQLVGTVDEGSK
jgi:hypothetical protein